MANVLAVGGPNSKYQQPNSVQAGFWVGLWHGLILPVTFLVSLFNPGVRMYEKNDRGTLYDLGFIIGIILILGGSGGAVDLVD